MAQRSVLSEDAAGSVGQAAPDRAGYTVARWEYVSNQFFPVFSLSGWCQKLTSLLPRSSFCDKFDVGWRRPVVCGHPNLTNVNNPPLLFGSCVTRKSFWSGQSHKIADFDWLDLNRKMLMSDSTYKQLFGLKINESFCLFLQRLNLVNCSYQAFQMWTLCTKMYYEILWPVL